MSFSNLKVQTPNSPDSTTHDIRNLQQCEKVDPSEILNFLEIKVENGDVNVKVLDADLPNTGENKHDDQKPILDVDSGLSHNQIMQNPQQPTFNVGKNNPKFCDGLFDKSVRAKQHDTFGTNSAVQTISQTVGNPQAKVGQAQASSTHTGPVYAGPTNGYSQAQAGHAQASSTHTGPVYAGPTNGYSQAQAGHAHVGPGHSQASSTHTGPVYAGPVYAGPVYAGPTNGNSQAQAGHAQASSIHTGPVYTGPTNGNSQAQAGHAHVGPGHSQASSNHTGPVYAGPISVNLVFQPQYHTLPQHAHALHHPAHAQQVVQFPNQVQSNRNWNHSILNGQIQSHAPQYQTYHDSAYHASAHYAIANHHLVSAQHPATYHATANHHHAAGNHHIVSAHHPTANHHHAIANHHHATSNHGSAHHHQQQQQLSGDHLGNAFGQDIESNLRQNQNVPAQCGPKKLPENPPIARKNGVKTRKDRTKYNTAQVFKLEKVFKSQRYLSPSEREDLARELQELERGNQVITEVEVKNWFKNRRSKNGKTPKKVQILVIED